MVIGNTSGSDLAVVDVSGKSSNDVVTFSDVDLQANTKYSVYMRSSNSRNRGFNDSPSFPYMSGDGNLKITAGWWVGGGGSDSGYAYNISEIGNIDM